VTAAERLRSLVLPSITLGIFGSALYARLVREELGTILQQDFVRTARAKGASRARVLVVHALRNALLPVATIAALELGTLVGGAVVTEKLFRWPGVGQLAVEAILNRDAPVVFGTVLFSATAVVAATLVLDLVYVVLDPRLRR
jgi:peptide/nickel transport system permease protein